MIIRVSHSCTTSSLLLSSPSFSWLSSSSSQKNFSSSSCESGEIELSLAPGVTAGEPKKSPTNVQLHDLSPPDILNETKQMIVVSKGPTRSSKQVGESRWRDSKYVFDRPPRHCLLTELRPGEGAILVPIWHNFCWFNVWSDAAHKCSRLYAIRPPPLQ